MVLEKTCYVHYIYFKFCPCNILSLHRESGINYIIMLNRLSHHHYIFNISTISKSGKPAKWHSKHQASSILFFCFIEIVDYRFWKEHFLSLFENQELRQLFSPQTFFFTLVTWTLYFNEQLITSPSCFHSFCIQESLF